MNLIRVLLVDVRDVVHLGYKRLLLEETWVERFETASDGSRAIELARMHRPQVAIIGAPPPHEDVAQLCHAIVDASPQTRLLIVAVEPVSTRRALGMGASGVVPRTWHGREILSAARTVAQGMSVFIPEPDRSTGLLTPRELEILELISGGATNREIAASVGLSANTVKDHTSTLYKKIRARNRAEAIARAERMGLLA